MDLAGSYIDLMMPGKPREDYPLDFFTTEYSGPTDKGSYSRFESMGDVRSARVPRNARPSYFASPGRKGSGFENIDTSRQF